MRLFDFSERGAKFCFFMLLGFWLLIPVPYWLIGMGLTDTFALLPSTDLLRTGEAWLWISTVAVFYGPLLMMGALLYMIARKRNGHNAED